MTISNNGVKPLGVTPSRDEIQLAHDMLSLVLTSDKEGEDLTIEIDDVTRIEMVASHNVLCWILGHTSNPSFESNMKALEQALDEQGIEIIYDTNENDYLN